MVLLLAALLGFVQFHSVKAVDTLTIDTSSGQVTGFVNNTAPNVAQFLGIPFAEQPVGERRWLPAIAKKKAGKIDATKFGNSCPQTTGPPPPGSESVYTEDGFLFNAPPYVGEDCLTVNVWTPYHKKGHNRRKNKDKDDRLPVIAWIYGGGFSTGGGNVPYQIPSQWIQRSQSHILVSINYRVNIFGFPNAAGLKDDEQNLGLLDQRLGVEWIEKNIHKFGGDKDRITLWGQSAGAMSVDYYNFAYPKDPIISGLIMDSGNALLALGSSDTAQSNFTFVADHFGCANSDKNAEVSCMRKVPHQDITNFTSTINNVTFVPIIDNRTKFANYTERALSGNFSKLPAIAGSNVDEGTAFVLPYDAENGPPRPAADAVTLGLFFCPTVVTTQNRYAAKTLTYRYLYGGNFSNIAPKWWEGAYHSAELPLVFGTHDIIRGASTEFELQVSHKMQDYWLAFAKDPEKGVQRLGWRPYEPQGEAVLIGWKGEVVQPIMESRLAEPCDGVNPRPGASSPPN